MKKRKKKQKKAQKKKNNKEVVDKTIKDLFEWEEKRKKKLQDKQKEETHKIETANDYVPKINIKSQRLAEKNKLKIKEPNVFNRLAEHDKILKEKKKILIDMYTPSFQPRSYVPRNMNLAKIKKKGNYMATKDNQNEEEEEEDEQEQKEESKDGDEEEEKEVIEKEKKPKQPKYHSNIIDLNEKEENQPTKKKGPETLYGIQIIGLPYETTEFELRQMFSKYGDIIRIYLPKYKNTNKNIGHCYIYFSTEESATKSLEMNNHRMGRRYMEISLYNMRNTTTKEIGRLDPDDIPLDCTTAFVKNLPYNVTEDMVREKFKPCGEINQLRFVYEPNRTKFKGFCYIDFKEHKGLVKALKLNGDLFEGRKLYVDYEQGKPKSNYKHTEDYKSGTSEVHYFSQKKY